MLTIAERRQRAIDLIESRKARGLSLSNKITQNALNTLAHLDDDVTVVYEPGQHRSQAFAEHTNGRHYDLTGAGVTVGAVFVPIQQATSADDHDANLGWSEPTKSSEDIEADAQDTAFEQTSETLGKLIRWLVDGGTLDSIGLRAVALACLVQPQMFEAKGKTRGVMSVAAARFGLTRAAVQKYSKEIRELTNGGFQARCQRSTAISTQRRLAATEQHRRAGHKVKAS